MTSNSSYLLIFSAHYDRDRGLDNGLLYLVDENYELVEKWTARTSTANKQYRGSVHQRGGMIPPVHLLKKVKRWIVDLNPLDSRNIKGIEGNFYRILPWLVKTIEGVQRGHFGFHYDGNVPGSLGCIVFDKRNWECFERTLAYLRAKGITKISLQVLIS